MKHVASLLSMIVLAVGVVRGGTCSDLILDLPAGGKAGTRAYADTPIPMGACLKGAFTFDVTVTDPAVIDYFVCYVRSGKGWYRTNFEPTKKDDIIANRSYHVTLSTAEILQVEGEPSGWSKSDLVRFAAYRVSSKPSVVKISNLSFDTAAKEVLFVRNGKQKESDAPYLENMRKAFAALGIPSMALDQDDLANGGLAGARLVVLAHAQSLSDACVRELEAFVAQGGKIFAAYSVPQPIARLVGVRRTGTVVPARENLSPLAGFVKGPAPLGGQPDFAPQASWACTRTTLLEGAKVAAWWRTHDGKTTDIPGLVVSSNGVYVSHVWLGEPEGAPLELFAAAVETVLPGTLARLKQVRVAEAARTKAVRERLAAMPGKSGERRLVWCHSAWGLGEGYDWDSTCRFVKENGFTDLLVNLAWGGCAFYPSKVLPRAEAGPRGDALEQCKAACRKHGLKMHVWKVCWNQGSHSVPSFTERLKKEGRVCVFRSGTVQPRWNCPSDPENQRLEIDAMTELALEKGVDGVHFDYIRYDGKDVCFCSRCRERFEKQIGRAVAKWPEDVSEGKPLFGAWNRFRCDNITTVVKTVHEKVKKVRPEVEISAAVFPRQETTDVAVGQDWVSWCRDGWLDFVCPMDYCERPSRFAAYIRSQRDALKGAKTKLYPGLAISCSSYSRVGPLVPALEIQEVREAGLGGFTVFNLDSSAERILPELRKGPLKDEPKVECLAVYYPHWHKYPKGTEWFGEKWKQGEWAFCRDARPRVPGQKCPVRPLFGFLDGKNPADVAKEIDLASNAGIDVFLWDWYWYGGEMTMQESLEEGFLKAPNRNKMKFCLMWCYHDRVDSFRDDPRKPKRMLMKLPRTSEDFLANIRYCVKFFKEPNYWTRNGMPFFSIYNANDLLRDVGGPEKMRELLEQARGIARAAGFKGIAFQGIKPSSTARANELAAGGFDYTGTYGNVGGEERRKALRSGTYVYDYSVLQDYARDMWRQLSAGELPYIPSLPAGDDATMRCRPEEPFPWRTPRYPYGTICTNNTPDRFQQLLQEAKDFAARDPKQPGAVLIYGWNEYTEGGYIAPNNFDADGALRAVAAVFGRKPKNEYTYVNPSTKQLHTIPAADYENVAYGPHAKQKIDVFLPKNAKGPFPVVQYIHGGGWSAGAMEDHILGSSIRKLLEKGIAVIGTGYRYLGDCRLDGVKPPVFGCLDDCEAAVRFVQAHAREWNLDLSRYALAGGSAGACTALDLALRNDNALGIRALAAIIPQTSMDPVEMREWIPAITYGGHAFGYRNFEEWLTHRDECRAAIDRVSPAALLRRTDPAKAPIVVMQGGAMDATHSPVFMTKFKELADGRGVSAEIVTGPEPSFGAAFVRLAEILSKDRQNEPR